MKFIFFFTFLLQILALNEQEIETNSIASDNDLQECGENCLWEYEGTTLKIKGTGDMFDYTKIVEDNPTMWHHLKYAVQTIEISEGITSIGDNSFVSFMVLKEVILPNSLKRIGKRAFSKCNTLPSITFPNSLEIIEENAFEWCIKLQQVELPQSLKTIGSNAFYGCTTVDHITIGLAVEQIGLYAFSYCKSLKSIEVASENKNYITVDGVLFNKNQDELIQYPLGNMKESYEIPQTVTKIHSHAFDSCQMLKQVSIPNSVIKIEESTFISSFSLKSIQFGNSIQTIESFAFKSTGLESIQLPDSLISINKEAFANCKFLKQITFGKSLQTFDHSSFDSCPTIESIQVSESNPNYSSIEGILFNKNRTTLIKYPSGKNEPSYIIPSTVETIKEYTFDNCQQLINITIPSSVKTIENYSFLNCAKLSNVMAIQVSEPTCYEWSFMFTESLKSITVPLSYTGKEFCKQPIKTTTICLKLTEEKDSQQEKCHCVENAQSVNEETCQCKEGYKEENNKCVISSSDNEMKTWEIVLIVIGSILLVIVLIIIVCFIAFLVRKKIRESKSMFVEI